MQNPTQPDQADKGQKTPNSLRRIPNNHVPRVYAVCTQFISSSRCMMGDHSRCARLCMKDESRRISKGKKHLILFRKSLVIMCPVCMQSAPDSLQVVDV